jgi:putative DNA primase/helicase
MAKNKIPRYLEDQFLAFQFIDKFRQSIRFCPELGLWFTWDGRRWKASFDKTVYRHFDHWLDQLGSEKSKQNKDTKKHLAKLTTQKRVLEYATRQLIVHQSELDQDTTLLNFGNCTLNLVSGESHDHDPQDFITKIIEHNYQPQAEAKRWNQFLSEIMAQDQEMVKFLQTAAGYGLTGAVSEHVLFMFYGAGRNGKSTFVETILELIGDYGHAVTNEFFASDKKDTHPTAIADLRGSRFVVGSEFTGNRLNEGLVKKLTGGDTQTARVMRGDYFKFHATHKFFMLVNDKPVIHGTNDGIWDRLKLVSFPQQFKKEESEKDLQKKMINSDQYATSGYGEAEGILAWLVDGAKRFYQAGNTLEPYPQKVVQEGINYRVEMDVFRQFLDDEVEVAIGQKIRSMELVNKYHLWCDENGVRFKGDKRWVHNEMEKNIAMHPDVHFKRSNGSWWVNVGWKSSHSSHSWSNFGQMGQKESQSQQGFGQSGQKKPIKPDNSAPKISDNGIYLSNLSKLSKSDIRGFKDLNKNYQLELIEIAWCALHGEEKGQQMMKDNQDLFESASGSELADDFETVLDVLGLNK